MLIMKIWRKVLTTLIVVHIRMAVNISSRSLNIPRINVVIFSTRIFRPAERIINLLASLILFTFFFS